jgi:ATP-binding cassette subfamily B protein
MKDQLALMRRILPLMWPEGEWGLRVRVVAALALILVAKGINVVVPIFYKGVVDGLTGVEAALAIPLMLILAYAVARVMAQATGEIRDLVFAKVHERGLRLISLHVLSHLHRLSLRFHLERQTGGLSRAIERGAEGIEFLISFLVFHIGPTLLELVLVAALLWHFFDFSFAAVTLGVIVAYAAYTAFGTRWRMKYRREVNAQDREANARAIDSLLNYETVKYFGNEAHEVERFDEAKREYVTAALKNQRALSWFNIGQAAILTGGVATIMVMAAYGVVQGRMTLGDFVMVNAYLIQLYAPLNMFGWIYRNLRQSMTDIEQMYELLAEEPEVNDVPDAPALARGPGRIVFDHVSFAYDPRRPILHDVSFETLPGRTTAIVGPTGSGKTTIARLLFRFYDPAAGRILIDGQDLRSISQASLRGAIGVVPQDAVLFNDTIAYNIGYGRPNASKEEIEEAARQAHLTDFIEKLPDGYLTKVGERGLKLSGGEKQRVAIARVVLKNPRLLIFDEATSSLDSRTEHEIQRNLHEVQADRTTLVIAHRLSTIVDADEILVLHDGRVIERGRHQELLARGGMYAAMWDKQRVAQHLAEVAE